MKKVIFILSFLFIMNVYVRAQSLSEIPNFEKYAKTNSQLAPIQSDEKRVVFIGNSITEGWANMRPEFFSQNNYIGRGIGGQTSPQLLLRFRQDVIDLDPVAVVINIGTNDIAENTGKYNAVYTLDNIKSMADIADANGIKVILSSVLPVGEYPWRKEIKNVPQTIDALNANIKAYAEENGYDYIDYNIEMRDANGALIDVYGSDGVHPTIKGYEVMEAIAKKVIDEVIE